MPSNQISFLSFDNPSSQALSIKFAKDDNISDMKRQLKSDMNLHDVSLAYLEFWRVKAFVKAPTTLEGQLAAFQDVRIDDVAECMHAPGDDASVLQHRNSDGSTTVDVLYRVRRSLERPDDMVGCEEEQDVAGEMRKRKRKHGEDSDGVQKSIQAQELDVTAAREALAPSSAARLSEFPHQQAKIPLMNGRPAQNTGPPIGLFHPVFNEFHAAMKSSDPVYGDTSTYDSIRALFSAFAAFYDSKLLRHHAINPLLEGLLNVPLHVVETNGVKSDGAFSQLCGRIHAWIVIYELKNEIGAGGSDPSNQGGLSYRKYWVGEKQDALRRRSCCPSIILAIAGPWMCVLGGIYLEKAIVQPLTDYIWLGGNIFDKSRLTYACRLFTALKSAITTLEAYYRALEPTLQTASSLNKFFPYIEEFQSTKFKYLERLMPQDSHKLIYKAKFINRTERTVVVKFAQSYCASAHRILAEHQLAPTLYYCSAEDPAAPKYGGRHMIVMEFIEDAKPATAPLPQHHYDQLKKAIEILHSNNLVFGDLRLPNIVVTGDDSVKLVDFDWCGEAGKSRYPADLNTGDNIRWAPGVEPDSIMLKEHDWFMLTDLSE